jgi:arsenate reductase-like glutaredoxin family protein|tara:strand:+ start:56 stop:289 length:234 start_codon:yes stop_codon:yes gene_type:complete
MTGKELLELIEQQSLDRIAELQAKDTLDVYEEEELNKLIKETTIAELPVGSDEGSLLIGGALPEKEETPLSDYIEED